MSIPYISNPTANAAIVPIDAWIEKPFSERLDNATTEYKITCSCKRENYTAIPFTRVMDTAGNAGLTQLPFAANANAYFLGDDNFTSSDGELITFNRTFGTKPTDITYMESDYSYGFPAFRSWWNNSSASNRDIFFANKGFDTPRILSREAFNKNVTAKYQYTYHISTQDGLDINPDSVFLISTPGESNDYSASSVTYFITIAASDSVNYVTDSVNIDQGFGFPDTQPSLSEYETYINNGTDLITESTVKHYKGNIFEKRTIKVKAQ